MSHAGECFSLMVKGHLLMFCVTCRGVFFPDTVIVKGHLLRFYVTQRGVFFRDSEGPPTYVLCHMKGVFFPVSEGPPT